MDDDRESFINSIGLLNSIFIDYFRSSFKPNNLVSRTKCFFAVRAFRKPPIERNQKQLKLKKFGGNNNNNNNRQLLPGSFHIFV
ncbi:hypothetical protein BLOT_003390 [Blomia tropicalis]|nr:hypothetical protein BLOT_003390 [Blomia tropicalis]